METSKVNEMAKLLAEEIQESVRDFEQTTGTYVHSIPVTRKSIKEPPTVDVKVQLTVPRL